MVLIASGTWLIPEDNETYIHTPNREEKVSFLGVLQIPFQDSSSDWSWPENNL